MKTVLLLLCLCVSAHAQNIEVGKSKADLFRAMARNKQAKLEESKPDQVTYKGWTIGGVRFDQCTFMIDRQGNVGMIVATKSPSSEAELASVVKAYKKVYGKGEPGGIMHSWKHKGKDITVHLLNGVLRILK